MSITSNNLKVREIIHQVVNDPHYKKVANIPLFSVPQIGLIVISYLGVLGGIALHIYAGISLWIVYPIMIFAFYTAFTPLHDATHRAVSSSKIINDILGSLAGTILFPLSNTSGYRYLHLAHHRYVGDKDLDPDEPMVYIPARYFPLGYLCLFFPDFLWVHWILFKAWKRTPIKTKVNILFMILGNVLFHTLWFMSPLGYEYLILFFIPNRLAIGYVSLAFAHFPHPEGLKWNDFPFQATYSLSGSKYYLWSLFGQKHHAMHHFLPNIPWYKYFQVWDLANGTFRKQNIPEKQVFTKPDIDYKKHIATNSTMHKDTLLVQITSTKEISHNIKTFVFEPAYPAQNLPPFTAGSHINVHLPSGKIRSYSCVNPPYEKNKYQIAVKLEPNGKGGSQEIHELNESSAPLTISLPKNNFLLYENTKKYILISGGIGITPLLSMAHRLTEIEKHFELHICTKSENEIPFRYELNQWSFAPNVDIHMDKNGKSTFNAKQVLNSPTEDTLIYICGPTGFNNWIKETALTQGWKAHQIKLEAFSKSEITITDPKPFEVILHKSKKSIQVQKDETIVDALQRNNIATPYSCLQGTCGTCITPVLKGEIDHRDAVLNMEEKTTHTQMCICVSRALQDQITLDL